MRTSIFLVCLGFGTFGAALTAIGATAPLQILSLIVLLAIGFTALFTVLSSGKRLAMPPVPKAAANT